MVRTKYINSLSRRFLDVIDREGVQIFDVTKNMNVTAFFRRFSNDKDTEEYKKMYCDERNTVDMGDVVKVDDEYYLVINRINETSNVYTDSVIEKCNATWSIAGQTINILCKDGLTAPDAQGNQVFRQISGSLTCICTESRLIHKYCQIDYVFYMFGGAYKIINTFFVNGVAYIYFQKTVTMSRDLEVAVNSTSTIKKYRRMNLNYLAQLNNYIAVNARYEVSVDDESVLTVDDCGRVRALKAGTANITITARYSSENGKGEVNHTISTVKTIEVLEVEPVQPDGENPYMIFDDGKGNIMTEDMTIGLSAIHIRALYYDADGERVTPIIPSWDCVLRDKYGNVIDRYDMQYYCGFCFEIDTMIVYAQRPKYLGMYEMEITATVKDGTSATITLEVDAN